MGLLASLNLFKPLFPYLYVLKYKNLPQRCQQGFVSSESSLLCLQMASFSMCPYIYMAFALCIPILVPLCVSKFLFLGGHHSDWVTTHMTSFNLNDLFQGSVFKYNYSVRYWVLRHMNLVGGGDTIQPITHTNILFIL